MLTSARRAKILPCRPVERHAEAVDASTSTRNLVMMTHHIALYAVRFSASVQCKAIRPNQQGEQCQRRFKMDPKGRRLLQRMRQASKGPSVVTFVQSVRGGKLCRANLQR